MAVMSLATRVMLHMYITCHRLLHRWGVLPCDRHFGVSRGSPVGRFYVDEFIQKNACYVHGRCLEFGENRYRFFFSRSDLYEVISIYSGPGVDYVCDIHAPTSLPIGVYDAVICTQVFEHLREPLLAAAMIHRLLKPGGVLLLTAPFINNIHGDPSDYYRYTPEGLRYVLERTGFTIEELEFGGNSLVSTGSLLGMVQEDFTRAELMAKDPAYPYNILIRARKPPNSLAATGAPE